MLTVWAACKQIAMTTMNTTVEKLQEVGEGLWRFMCNRGRTLEAASDHAIACKSMACICTSQGANWSQIAFVADCFCCKLLLFLQARAQTGSNFEHSLEPVELCSASTSELRVMLRRFEVMRGLCIYA